MNSNRMRRIDRWLGGPICFVLTLAHRMGRWLSRPWASSSNAPRNVLFLELAEMGSLVLASPAVRQLKTAHPDARVYFLVFERNREAVTVLNLTSAERVITIDPSSIFTLARDSLRFVIAARRQCIDTTINLEMFARFSTILSYLSGANTRVGFAPFTEPGLYAGDLLTHKVIYNPHVHTAQSFLVLVKALAQPTASLPMGKWSTPSVPVVPKITRDLAAQQRARDRIDRENPRVAGKRLIVVNPNASELISMRKWPLVNYARLTDRLLDDPRYACVITGVMSERSDAQFITDRIKSDRIVDLTGKTSLKDLIDLYTLSDLLVSNDSGPAQFAALTDMHVLVFFGPETPALYKPLTDHCTVMYSAYACSPCVSAFNQRRTDCTDNKCLKEITVDEVYAKVVEILKHKAPA